VGVSSDQLASIRHELHRLANAIAARDALIMRCTDRLDLIERELAELQRLLPELVRVPPPTPSAPAA
jgi:hypothetical protein